MNANSNGKFIWLPRILAIVFSLFLMLFSFDVFSMEGSLLMKIGGFFFHSLPSLTMFLIIALFWNNPLKSGLIYLVLGIIFTFLFDTYKGLPNFLFISLPPLSIAALFLIVHKLNTEAGDTNS